jgi:Xaa-Pro aminopeptidase
MSPPLAVSTGRPPGSADLARWLADDRAARPARLALFRQRLEREGVDAYFGVRRENSRYLTGFELADGEEKVAGNSGQFLVSADEAVVLADSRYTVQAQEQCPDARLERVYNTLSARWPELLSSLKPVGGNGMRRVAVEAGFVSHALWGRLAEASPAVELVPAEGWIEELRATKEPSELERIASACAVADGALTRLLPSIRPGVTEHELALQLEWEMRTSGAEALAFDVACLSGPRAALPHGSPGQRQVAASEVLLFDFGAQVCGYRSDMTRTLFVGQPRPDDVVIYELVARAQQAAFTALRAGLAHGSPVSARQIDAAARDVITAAGHGEHYGHGLGHGIGLATHEAPSLGQSVPPDAMLPSPTVFSVEPGVYLDHQTGVRIEDLVVFDASAGHLARLTTFPREMTVVGE